LTKNNFWDIIDYEKFLYHNKRIDENEKMTIYRDGNDDSPICIMTVDGLY
jgi:hypothetical protein